MAELIHFMPANEDDYSNYPCISLHLVNGSYHVYAINVAGDTEEKAECFYLIAALAHVTCVLARTSEVEYIVETPN